MSVIFRSFLGKIAKAIALLLDQHWRIFINSQSPSKSMYVSSCLFSARYHDYSLILWRKYVSLRNQIHSISTCAIFQQRVKAIALPFDRNCFIVIIFKFAIKISEFHFWSSASKCQRPNLSCFAKFAHFQYLSVSDSDETISIWVTLWQIAKATTVPFGQNSPIFITFYPAIKINKFRFGYFLAKSKAIDLVLDQN